MIKKLGIALVLSLSHASIASGYGDSDYSYESSIEREMIWNEIHFATKKMNLHLGLAEKKARMIKDTSIKNLTAGAIEGAIAGLAGRSVASVVIGGCLGAISKLGGESYIYFRQSKAQVVAAHYYAKRIEDLEEQLWTME